MGAGDLTTLPLSLDGQLAKKVLRVFSRELRIGEISEIEPIDGGVRLHVTSEGRISLVSDKAQKLKGQKVEVVVGKKIVLVKQG